MLDKIEIETAKVREVEPMGRNKTLTDKEGQTFEVELFKYIQFKMQEYDFNYVLLTYKKGETWKPHMVAHDSLKKECPICGLKTLSECDLLNKYLHEMFKKLLNSEVFRFQALSEFPKKMR